MQYRLITTTKDHKVEKGMKTTDYDSLLKLARKFKRANPENHYEIVRVELEVQ